MTHSLEICQSNIEHLVAVLVPSYLHTLAIVHGLIACLVLPAAPDVVTHSAPLQVGWIHTSWTVAQVHAHNVGLSLFMFSWRDVPIS